jgi:hypothetical protein
MDSGSRQRVVLVDDDLPTRAAMANRLTEAGYDVHEFDDSTKAPSFQGGDLVVIRRAADDRTEQHRGAGTLESGWLCPPRLLKADGRLLDVAAARMQAARIFSAIAPPALAVELDLAKRLAAGIEALQSKIWGQPQ